MKGKENFLSFRERLEDFSDEEKELLERAYHFAKLAHRGQERDGGERYFEHIRGVFLILFDECGVRDISVLLGAMLHDVVEDTALFGNPMFLEKEKREEVVKKAIGDNFGEEVAEIVWLLTKPFEGGEVGKEEYLGGLRGSSEKVILIKMADRLHNMRSLITAPLEKRVRKVVETEDYYLEIFLKVEDKYPMAYGYMLKELIKEIENLRGR